MFTPLSSTTRCPKEPRGFLKATAKARSYVEELGLPSAYRDKTSAIVVDDFRNFGIEDGFPAKSASLKSAETHFGTHGFNIAVYLDQLIISRKSSRPSDS